MSGRDSAPFLVVHVPHSSLVIPDQVRSTFTLDDDALADELRRMTDRFTDELFAFPSTEAWTVAANASRLVVDVERFPSDDDEPMAAVGMGAVYTRTSRGTSLRADGFDRAALVEQYYEPHHRALFDATRRALEAHGRCLLVDAHSFSSVPLPHEPDQRLDRPDICLGTDASHTPDWLRDTAVRLAEAAGWTVAVDRPFAGAIVPREFYGSDVRVISVMIEVNRALYMDEHTGVKLADFAHVRDRLVNLVRGLAIAAERVEPEAFRT